MIQYEWKVVCLAVSSFPEAVLNDMTQQGWEVFTITDNYIYFRRMIRERVEE